MKDISVYNMLGLNPSQIYIVGRPSKKYQNQCQVARFLICVHYRFFSGISWLFCVRSSLKELWFSPHLLLIFLLLCVFDLLTISVCVCSSWARDMQHTSPRSSLGTEPDLRNPPRSAWSWEKVRLASRPSPTSCVSAPTCAGPCRSSSLTRPARPTPNQSEPRASQSQTKTTVEVEEVVGKGHGDGPPCIVETPLPDIEKGL